MLPSPGQIALIANAKDYREVTPDSATALILSLDCLNIAVPQASRFFGIATENESDWPSVVWIADKYNRLPQFNLRPVFIQDGPGPFPASVLATMPRWSLPIRELYRYKGETLDDAQQRWAYEAAALERDWHYDLGAVIQTYTMSIYSIAEVEAIAIAGVEHLNNRGPRWKTAFTFAWAYPIGGDIPALATLQSTIIAQTPGWPTFEPVEHPIPPPPVKVHSIVPLC